MKKQYINFGTHYSDNIKAIPNDPRNKDFMKMNEEVSNGEAEIIEYQVDLDQYKASNKREIDKKTESLISSGFIHNDVQFEINIEKEVSALALNNVRMAGTDMTGKKFRAKNAGYTFLSNDDFDAFFSAGFGRLEFLINGGSDLKDAIDEASNFDEVDAIIDERTQN